ncbi:hypothetical protein Terro_2913 [Terriglobus roseus DSM 18391]|uniref:Uncharacterized protein n=2 Tax=Terriglobus roseus TaxID=392734 RepID=I3ZIT0_TERRK|nr:hypothetical protein Terro_2913 [Terriglobus roseus DSM 18391]
MIDESVSSRRRGSIHRRQVVKLLALSAGTLLAGRLWARSPLKTWRQASDAELREILPARAPVGHEHIETEMRTASGITDGHGEFVAGVVLITTGYAANGKYSHFLTTQIPLEVGTLALAPGEYVLGWEHGDTMLNVHFYDANTEALRGSAEARIIPGLTRVESFRLWSPQTKSILQIGRFGVRYAIGKSAQ